MYVCMYIPMCVRMYVVHMHVRMYVHNYVCMHIYIDMNNYDTCKMAKLWMHEMFHIYATINNEW